MKWGDAYSRWLRARGVAIADVGIHMRIASRIVAEAGSDEVEQRHVDEARANTTTSSTPAQTAVFDELATVFMEFQAELKSGTFSLEPPEPEQGRDDAIDLEPMEGAAETAQPEAEVAIDLEPMEGAAETPQPEGDAAIDLGPLEPSADEVVADDGPVAHTPAVDSPAAPRSERPPSLVPPGNGRWCRYCGGAVEIDYGQKRVAISAVLVAVVGAAMGFFLGLAGATAVLLFGASVAAAISWSLVAHRCTKCQRDVDQEKLTEEEIVATKRLRLRLGATSAASLIGAAVMALVWVVIAENETDPRDAVLVSTVETVAHRIESDRNLHEQAGRYDPNLVNDSIIMSFFSAEYLAGTPRPPEGIGLCRFPPERPYCVVVRTGDDPQEIVIEGYAADRETVLARETVVVRPP